MPNPSSTAAFSFALRSAPNAIYFDVPVTASADTTFFCTATEVTTTPAASTIPIALTIHFFNIIPHFYQ